MTLVADAMWNISGCYKQFAGAHGDLLVFEKELTLSRNHQVDLVDSFVGMQGVLLAWLERIHAHQHPIGMIDGALAHFFPIPRSMLLRTNAARVGFFGFHGVLQLDSGEDFHRSSNSTTASWPDLTQDSSEIPWR